ncbi:hypothetical protein Anapl_03410 [Anas platyrhynchos]|uniref:Uncharacterized protein n=1 Tax=Anas platyrhynchos TaxID=8839 RepID=R0K9E4_ANAPL|nr:hypothetical protein Anapl_03410 [Anas platyrhynchos]
MLKPQSAKDRARMAGGGLPPELGVLLGDTVQCMHWFGELEFSELDARYGLLGLGAVRRAGSVAGGRAGSAGFFGSSAAWGVCVVEEPGNFGFGASFNAIKATVRVLVVGS